jgi:hypothetical protein
MVAVVCARMGRRWAEQMKVLEGSKPPVELLAMQDVVLLERRTPRV